MHARVSCGLCTRCGLAYALRTQAAGGSGLNPTWPPHAYTSLDVGVWMTGVPFCKQERVFEWSRVFFQLIKAGCSLAAPSRERSIFVVASTVEQVRCSDIVLRTRRCARHLLLDTTAVPKIASQLHVLDKTYKQTQVSITHHRTCRLWRTNVLTRPVGVEDILWCQNKFRQRNKRSLRHDAGSCCWIYASTARMGKCSSTSAFVAHPAVKKSALQKTCRTEFPRPKLASPRCPPLFPTKASYQSRSANIGAVTEAAYCLTAGGLRGALTGFFDATQARSIHHQQLRISYVNVFFTDIPKKANLGPSCTAVGDGVSFNTVSLKTTDGVDNYDREPRLVFYSVGTLSSVADLSGALMYPASQTGSADAPTLASCISSSTRRLSAFSLPVREALSMGKNFRTMIHSA